MARARRSFRRNDRSGLIWTATASDGLALEGTAPAATNVVQFPVVNMGLDVGGGIGQESATLLRIRGWFNIVSTQSEAGNCSIMGGVAVSEDDAAIVDFTDVANYTQQDILWTWGMNYHAPSIIMTEPDYGRFVEVDIKSKRRLKEGQQVTLNIAVAVGSTGPLFLVSGVLRALLKTR